MTKKNYKLSAASRVANWFSEQAWKQGLTSQIGSQNKGLPCYMRICNLLSFCRIIQVLADPSYWPPLQDFHTEAGSAAAEDVCTASTMPCAALGCLQLLSRMCQSSAKVLGMLVSGLTGNLQLLEIMVAALGCGAEAVTLPVLQ